MEKQHATERKELEGKIEDAKKKEQAVNREVQRQVNENLKEIEEKVRNTMTGSEEERKQLMRESEILSRQKNQSNAEHRKLQEELLSRDRAERARKDRERRGEDERRANLGQGTRHLWLTCPR